MAEIDVGAVADFPSDRASVVTVGRRQIGIAVWRGQHFALRNVCPHLGAALCAGQIAPLLIENPERQWDLIADADRPMIVCPWHRWQFDLRTGHALVGHLRVKTYPVHERAGRVIVDI